MLYPSSFEKDLSPEEKSICRRYDPFMRFHSKEDHENMLHAIIGEHRTRKRILELEVKSYGYNFYQRVESELS